MRGRKGSEYDGGHRVPFFIHWPAGGLSGGRDADQLTAHIDVLPTLLDLCGVEKPDGPPLDGTSLAAVLKGDETALRNRTLFVHSQRLEHVVKWRKCSVMTPRWRLVNGTELYDVQSDPGQTRDVAAANPQVVAQMTASYDAWWDSLSPVFDEYVRISLGADQENPAHLTCHDWHTDRDTVPWNHQTVSKDPAGNGFWAVNVVAPGTYEFHLRTRPAVAKAVIPTGTARLRIGDVDQSVSIDGTSTAARIIAVLKPGPQRLQTWLTTPDGAQRGAYFVEVELLD
jgi:hypothetical protein